MKAKAFGLAFKNITKWLRVSFRIPIPIKSPTFMKDMSS